MLIVTAITIVRLRNLFAVVMISGIYSFLMAILFTVLDAVDVAFTEAAVGAGATTVLGLAALSLTTDKERPHKQIAAWPLVTVSVTGLALLLTVPDMPRFGDPAAPAHHHVVPRYVTETPEAIGIPNVVTAVLADYRGFDTLGEVAVIFTAGIGVLLIIGRTRRRKGGPT